jgi:isoamylase
MGGFEEDADLHVMLNMDSSDLDFDLPAVAGRRWYRAFDTSLPTPLDAAEPGREQPIEASGYRVNRHSVVVLISK